jgi:hypothetical protein
MTTTLGASVTVPTVWPPVTVTPLVVRVIGPRVVVALLMRVVVLKPRVRVLIVLFERGVVVVTLPEREVVTIIVVLLEELVETALEEVVMVG